MSHSLPLLLRLDRAAKSADHDNQSEAALSFEMDPVRASGSVGQCLAQDKYRSSMQSISVIHKHPLGEFYDNSQLPAHLVGMRCGHVPLAEVKEGLKDAIRIAGEVNEMLAVRSCATSEPKFDRALAGACPSHCCLDHATS
jgi:hypothetical protein